MYHNEVYGMSEGQYISACSCIGFGVIMAIVV